MADDALRLEEIHVSYRKAEVIHGVSLTVPSRSRVAMLGANGAGKTTILKAISGMVVCRAGRVLLEGEDVTNRSAVEMVDRGVIHVPEGRRVFGRLSVEDNLKVALYRRKGDVRRQIELALHLFPRLKERFKVPAGLLSGGEQQMLVLGRALMARPRLLLLDELSLGLAPAVAKRVYEALDSAVEGLSVLLVEQNARLALARCSHVYVLRNGLVSQHGQAAVFDDPEHLRAAYMGTL